MDTEHAVAEFSDAEVDRLFQALADATRRDIVARVIEREQSVSELAEHYAMSFAAVQKHVAVLERAALVGKVRRGREQIVHGDPATLRKASALLEMLERLWHQRIATIDDLLAADLPADDLLAEDLPADELLAEDESSAG